MSSYVIQAGDTLESISRANYGIESLANIISISNPGLTLPLIQGTVINIPKNPKNRPKKYSNLEFKNEDEIAIMIDGTRFHTWNSLSLNRIFDSIDTLDVTAPFEPDLPSFRQTFKPFSFKDVEVIIGGQRLFTGTIINIVPTMGKEKSIQISAYARCGILNDCTAPASAYPIEYNKQNLKDISDSLTAPFGIVSSFEEDVGEVFERVALDPGQKILDFLSELAKQRNLVISNDTTGNLVYRKAISSGKPVAKLQQGEASLLSISPEFNPQQYYSHITGLEPVSIGGDGGTYTVQNSKLTSILRPFTYEVQDVESGELKNAVDSKAGRMFGNMVSYKISINTWRTSNKLLWEPNTIINLQSDNAMIYKPYNLVIRGVQFKRDKQTKTAELDLVLPGSFSGKVPEVLPWD